MTGVLTLEKQLMATAERQQVRKYWRRKGVTTVEMAVASPVFFLIVFSLMEFSRMAMVQHAMTSVAREGCRRASLASTADSQEVESWMRQQLKSSIPQAEDTDVLHVALSPASLAGIPSGTEVTATITVEFSAVSWLPPTFLKSAQLAATASAKRE